MSKERKISLYGEVIPLLIQVVEKAYFETTEPKEKKLLANFLSKLQ